MIRLTHSELIQALQSTDSNKVNEGFRLLHRQLYRKVVKYIKNLKGNTQDAEDIFQDGLLALYKLIRRDHIKQDTNIEAYLFTICKNLWLQKIRKKPHTVGIEVVQNFPPIEETLLFSMINKEEQDEIQRLLSLLGKSCKEVLIQYYYKRVRMLEIAQLMGYSSPQVAKNKKSNCMKKFKELVLNSSILNTLK